MTVRRQEIKANPIFVGHYLVRSVDSTGMIIWFSSSDCSRRDALTGLRLNSAFAKLRL
jgi:hypothetical protein